MKANESLPRRFDHGFGDKKAESILFPRPPWQTSVTSATVYEESRLMT